MSINEMGDDLKQI